MPNFELWSVNVPFPLFMYNKLGDKVLFFFDLSTWDAIVVKNKSMCPSLLTSADETPVVTIILSLKRPAFFVTSVKFHIWNQGRKQVQMEDS